MAVNESVLAITTLDPLPDVLRRGLVAVSFFGVLSLISSLSLFSLLTYRLCCWYYQGQLRDGVNQFILLIFNLVLADIQQAMAFSLPSVYLANSKIEVGTTTCWANGWFVSTGDLASGVFIFAIAVHTFFAVVKGRQMSNKAFFVCIACLWTFVYAMAIAGVALDPKLYVRAGAWCWVDKKYNLERLWLHYFWIFLCMFGSVIIYGLVFLSIHVQSRQDAHTTGGPSSRADSATLKRAAKYMIIYPVVYIVCTLPLAGGRMAAMTGVHVPYWWYCLAGSAIASCGWLDVLLYAVTRRVLVFSSTAPRPDDLGLENIGWAYPDGSFWGTTTTVTGPLTHTNTPHHTPRQRGHKLSIIGGGSTRFSLHTRYSDEDCFTAPEEGVINMETTVEVHSGPIVHYSGSEFSDVEHHDKDDGPRSR